MKKSYKGCKFLSLGFTMVYSFSKISPVAVTAEDVKIELQGTEIVFDPPFEEGFLMRKRSWHGEITPISTCKW